MNKLGNFLYGDVIMSNPSGVGNQDPNKWLHGALQGNQAIDCYGSSQSLDWRCPQDGQVTSVSGTGQDRCFNFSSNGIIIQFVHSVPDHMGFFKKGDHLGKSAWHHLHVAVRVGGVWFPIVDFMDQSIIIRPESNKNMIIPFSAIKYLQDRDSVTGLLINNSTMATLDYPIPCKTLNTADANIRSTPDTTTPNNIIGVMKPLTKFVCTKVTDGQTITQNGRTSSLWYWVGNGWFGGCWVNYDLPAANCDAVTAELNTTKQKLEEANEHNAQEDEKMKQINTLSTPQV